MAIFSEIFKDFDSYEYSNKDAFDYLFAKVMVNEAVIHGLREFTLTKLSETLNVPYEDLQKEFSELCEPYYQNAAADFLAKFGSTDNPQGS